MSDEATTAPAVEFEDVRFRYVSDTPVLKGISATLRRGEFITIIGQNGSGKSTLVKHLNGLLKPNRGVVRVHGDNVFDTREQSMRTLARIVGYVFQNPDDQIFHTTIREEIAYGLDNIGVPPDEYDDRIADVLEMVNLDGQQDANPFSLGKGQRQRLAIASVLAMAPQVIVVDEPTTGQDRNEAVRIMDILEDYNDRGHTVITITHDIALAAAYTDRVIVMRDGQIIADGSPEIVFLDEEHLEQTNIRPPQITQLGTELRKRSPDAFDDLWLTVDDAEEDLWSLIDRHTAATNQEDN